MLLPSSRPQALTRILRECAPADLCRHRLLGTRQWLPVPCGGCPRRPLSRRRLRLLGPRQWLPIPCGGCPRRPMSRRRLLLLGPRQWLPVPCGGCPRRPMSRRRLLLLGPRQWLPSPVEVAPAGLCRVVASFFTFCYFLTETRSFFRQRWPRFDWIFDFISFDEIFLRFYYYYK